MLEEPGDGLLESFFGARASKRFAVPIVISLSLGAACFQVLKDVIGLDFSLEDTQQHDDIRAIVLLDAAFDTGSDVVLDREHDHALLFALPTVGSLSMGGVGTQVGFVLADDGGMSRRVGSPVVGMFDADALEFLTPTDGVRVDFLGDVRDDGETFWPSSARRIRRSMACFGMGRAMISW